MSRFLRSRSHCHDFFRDLRLGGILFLTAVSLILILGIMALVVDISWIYFHRNKLEFSVNSAWIAGVDEIERMWGKTFLPIGEKEREKIKTRILDIFRENGYPPGSNTAISINFTGCSTFTENIEITVTKKLELFFAPSIDFSFINLQVSSKDFRRKTGFPIKAVNEEFPVPIGIPHGEISPTGLNHFVFKKFEKGESFSPEKEYILRLGTSSSLNVASISGSLIAQNHGSLHCQGFRNSNDYRNCLIFGFPKPLLINQRIPIASSDLDLITSDGINNRFAQNPSGQFAIFPIVDIPPELESQESPKPQTILELSLERNPQVRIIGFASFEITSPTSVDKEANFPGEIKGKFLRYIVNPSDVINLLN